MDEKLAQLTEDELSPENSDTSINEDDQYGEIPEGTV